MTTFVEDSLTDTDNTLVENHTGEIGATWTKHSLTATGSAQISNANRAHSTTANPVIYTASGVPPAAEYSVSGPWRVITDINDLCGFVARFASPTVANGYTTYMFGAGSIYLARLDAGAETILATLSETYSLNTDINAIFQLKNGAIKLFLEGIEKLSSADNTYTAAGLVGLFFNLVAATDTTGSHIGSFLAVDTAPPPATLGQFDPEMRIEAWF